MSQPYTLYGAPFSLYTGKARSYLRYKQIDFVEQLSTAKVYKNIIVPETGVRFIPVLETPDGRFIQDTAVIMDELETKYPNRPILPSTPKQRIVSQLFELYGDEWLLLPAMHYRWNKDNDDYIYRCFGSMVLPNWPHFIQRFIGKKVGAKFKGFVPMLGITPETIPALEHWYEAELLPLLNEHFASHDYLLGGAASVGDFGLMGSLYAHLYMDPYPGEVMKRTAPNIVRWIERMNSEPSCIGEWLADDAIPQTLHPILALLFRDHWPVVQSTIEEFNHWSTSNSQRKVPRKIGEHDFHIEQTRGRRAILTFTLWKYQRIQSSFLAFNTEGKATINDYLLSCGGTEVFARNVTPAISRDNNLLIIAD